MAKILITGAAGMLGTDLVSALRDHFELVGVGLSEGTHLPIAYHRLDLTDRQAVSEFWQKTRPSLVIHLAAMTQVDLCETERDRAYQANTEAVKAVADASRDLGATLVFFSTDFVFDGKENREYREEDSCAPLSYYGETKRQAEEYLKSSGVSFVVFRICWLYGLGGRSFPRAILEIAEKQTVLRVVSDQIGRPTYTKDICGALRELLLRDKDIFSKVAGNFFHLANSGTASWADFAEEVLKDAGHLQHQVVRITAAEFNRPAPRPAHAVMNLDKTHEMLGVQLRPWQEALKVFIAEYRTHTEIL